MKNPLHRITIVFIVIALLPISIMVYELGLLNKNEKLVRETYQNQLDAILYSVNQYSDDILSSWANRIRLELRKDGESTADLPKRFQAIVNQSDVVPYVYFSNLKGKTVVYNLDENKPAAEIGTVMDRVLKRESGQIEKLISYAGAGFRKMEPVNAMIQDKFIPILFVLDEDASDYVLGALIVDLSAFIENNLAPKMQAISQDRFIISAFRAADDSLIYSTASAPNTTVNTSELFKSELQTTELWLLPGYYLGISLQGASIETLVKDRTSTSITILALLVLILGAGIFFLYRNIKREIQLSQAKSEFVSNVSHEIRTPLSLIGMFAETLEMGRVNSEEKKKEYYSIIGKETARLSRIVNRILNFSQLDANKKVFAFEALQLNALCSEILQSYFHHLSDKGFVFEFHEGTHMPAIRGDREAISEAIINLLDNAIKYSRDKKNIIVTTGCDQHTCYVEVKDEGIGIEKNHQKAVFDQFYRAPTGDVHTTKGSGLGLALVKKIMDAHQGEVTLTSAVDKGSTFRLSFPLKSKQST